MYLPLFQVADTTFHIQGDDMVPNKANISIFNSFQFVDRGSEAQLQGGEKLNLKTGKSIILLISNRGERIKTNIWGMCFESDVF